MSSNFKFIQCLEWCTPLPSVDQPRESPIFLLQGNEWFFRFITVSSLTTWYYGLYVELKNEHAILHEESEKKIEVGFKKEETLSLRRGTFKISKHYQVWYMSVKNLQEKLPSDYMDGNWIKFLFFFDDVVEPPVKITKATGE